MAAISYVIGAGGTLETITTGTNAPSSGVIEVRIDQTTTTVTDSGSTRAPRRGELYTLLTIIEQYLLKDTNISQ